MTTDNKTTFAGAQAVVGEEFQITYNSDQNYIFISEDAGPGSMDGTTDVISVERKSQVDGTWKSYPATDYFTADAFTIDYPSGSTCRVRISSATPVTVEITG